MTSFKSLKLTPFFCMTLLFVSCMHRSDNLNSRVKYNFEEEKITPLNKEACLYLAYKALLTKDTDLAKDYLTKGETLPGSDLIELKEGLKTLQCLVLLQDNEYENAETNIAALAKVSALPEPKNNVELKTYHMYRRIRSSSIQLRASLASLKEFNSLKGSHMLSLKKYNELKSNWLVQLTGSEYGSMYKISYTFPAIPVKE